MGMIGLVTANVKGVPGLNLDMTDEYFAGKGHPITVKGKDPTGSTNKKIEYSDDIHGHRLVMCSRRSQYCKNMEVPVKDYAKHLRQYHNMEIDPVQERLMKSSAMINPKLKNFVKYVWAPFPYQLPLTIYEMHLEEIIREKEARLEFRGRVLKRK